MDNQKALEILEKLASYDDITDLLKNHSVSVQDALLYAIKVIKQICAN